MKISETGIAYNNNLRVTTWVDYNDFVPISSYRVMFVKKNKGTL